MAQSLSMRLLIALLALSVAWVAQAQIGSAPTTNALALRVPSATSPFVVVGPADGSSFALWRYAPSSTSTDYNNALVTTLGTGRWLRVPYTGTLSDVAITGGTLDVDLITVDELNGLAITVPYTGETEPPNYVAPISMVKELTPAIAADVTDLLAANVIGLSRWGYVQTGTYTGIWVYCPEETTADNGTTIRRPDEIASDATPGRWEYLSLSGGGSGTVTSITLTQPAAGLTITGSGTAITSTGTPTFALANDLAAVEGLSGTGYAKRTGTDTWSLGSTVPWGDLSSTPTTLSGYGISDGITSAAVAAGYQPLDGDLTAIAALTTTSFGRGLLDEADASALRTTAGLVIGSNVQAYDADLTTYAGITPSANVQTLLGAANYAAFKTSLSLDNVENTAISTWAGSANITTLGTISSGTVPVARVTGLATVATSASASDLSTGTLPDGRFPATLPAASGVNLTALNASNLGSGTVASARLPSPGRPVTYVVDNSGSAITAGDSTIASVPVEVTGTITKAVLIADQSGSAVVDVKKATYSGFPTTSSIAASAKPTLSAAQKASDSTLTGWTTSVTAGDILQFRVDSASTVTRLTLILTITPP